MSQNDDGYEVGYKKPPLHSRFQKGHTGGNRAGRKKGSRNLKSDLLEELAQLITINEGDRTVRMTKQRALIRASIHRGLKGSDPATARMLELLVRLTAGDEEPGSRAPTDEEDLAIIARHLADRGGDHAA